MIYDVWVMLLERREFFFGLLLEHMKISLIAIGFAIVLGGIIGIVISEYQKTTKTTLGVINFLYTIPSISMLGFLIPFSGVGNATAIIALTVYALLPMVRNTHTGMVNIEPSILEAAKGMGSTRFQILYKIKIPLAMPVIMSGIRNMVTMTIALAGIASFIGAGGLGVAIYRGITTNNTTMTIVGSTLIALLALCADLLLGLLEKQMQKRTNKSKKRKFVYSTIIIALCLAFVSNIVHTAPTGDIIKIATKPMTEQYIIGEILQLLIEQNTDLQVELTQGVGGGTSNIQPAMEKGEFDLYPEYTGTAWNMVLKKDGLYITDMFDQLQEEYRDTLSMQWLGMYGFNNTYGLAIRKEIAETYNIRSYSDLAAFSDQLVFGAEYDFYEREDGFDAVSKAYNLHFKDTMDIDIGLKYQAINQGSIDVMNIFTTDGQLSVSDVIVLEDDKQFYPSYMAGTVIRIDTLQAYPELEEVLETLRGVLSDKEIARMNYEVESEGKEPRIVAQEFLNTIGLLQ